MAMFVLWKLVSFANSCQRFTGENSIQDDWFDFIASFVVSSVVCKRLQFIPSTQNIRNVIWIFHSQGWRQKKSLQFQSQLIFTFHCWWGLFSQRYFAPDIFSPKGFVSQVMEIWKNLNTTTRNPERSAVFRLTPWHWSFKLRKNTAPWCYGGSISPSQTHVSPWAESQTKTHSATAWNYHAVRDLWLVPSNMLLLREYKDPQKQCEYLEHS